MKNYNAKDIFDKFSAFLTEEVIGQLQIILRGVY